MLFQCCLPSSVKRFEPAGTALVNTEDPLCVGASTLYDTLEYGGIFGVMVKCAREKKPQDVNKVLASTIAELLDKGVTAEELDRAKMSRRIETIHSRETCDEIGGAVGDAELWAGDPDRVNNDLAKLEAVTAQDVQAVAKKYLNPNQVTVLTVKPDPLGTQSRKAAAAANAMKGNAPVVASTRPIMARDVQFPADYPEHPPLPPAKSTAAFAKGQDAMVNGIHLVVLTDSRLPLVSWTLAMRHGSHNQPADKAGLATMTAEMLSHGTAKHTFQQLSDEEESHGISIGVGDAGDGTDLSGSCTTAELDHGFALSREILLSPTFPEDEFKKLKDQSQAGLLQSLSTPATAASREMTKQMYAGSPLGNLETPHTLADITLDDVKKFYADFYHPNDAIMIVSGDITFDRAKQLTQELTDGWKPKDMPAPDTNFPPSPTRASSSSSIPVTPPPEPARSSTWASKPMTSTATTNTLAHWPAHS